MNFYRLIQALEFIDADDNELIDKLSIKAKKDNTWESVDFVKKQTAERKYEIRIKLMNIGNELLSTDSRIIVIRDSHTFAG